jgi:quinol monooxygenase YgiN
VSRPIDSCGMTRPSHGITPDIGVVARHMSEAAGAVLQMTALPGKRDELIRVLTNYANTLDGEPGTTLFAAAADPSDDDIVWVWEEFASIDAVREHFEHDFFRALQLELADLLDGPAAVRPLAPFVRRTNQAPSPTE